jgi:hypothetical protein
MIVVYQLYFIVQRSKEKAVKRSCSNKIGLLMGMNGGCRQGERSGEFNMVAITNHIEFGP